MTTLVSLHGCIISMCTGEAGRFLRGPLEREYGKQNKLESDSSNAFSFPKP